MTTDLTPYSKKLALPADFDLVWRECEFRDMKPSQGLSIRRRDCRHEPGVPSEPTQRHGQASAGR